MGLQMASCTKWLRQIAGLVIGVKHYIDYEH
jgi:uncharacterized short protein YbdD (DUF466 family)